MHIESRCVHIYTYIYICICIVAIQRTTAISKRFAAVLGQDGLCSTSCATGQDKHLNLCIHTYIYTYINAKLYAYIMIKPTYVYSTRIILSYIYIYIYI